jgi:hypothetical protein
MAIGRSNRYGGVLLGFSQYWLPRTAGFRKHSLDQNTNLLPKRIDAARGRTLIQFAATRTKTLIKGAAGSQRFQEDVRRTTLHISDARKTDLF